MSALGQMQTFRRFSPMSALPPKADTERCRDVRFVPIGDIIRGLIAANIAKLPELLRPKELDAMTADQPMTAEQAATLKRLAEAAYELEAFQPNLTRAEADLRISMLTTKLKLLDGPPHTL